MTTQVAQKDEAKAPSRACAALSYVRPVRSGRRRPAAVITRSWSDRQPGFIRWGAPRWRAPTEARPEWTHDDRYSQRPGDATHVP